MSGAPEGHPVPHPVPPLPPHRVPHGRTPEVRRGPLGAALDGLALSRWPYPESPELQAWDATDRLLLDTAQGWWDAGHGGGAESGPRQDGVGQDGAGRVAAPAVVVLEDRHGALTLPLLLAGHTVHLAQDALAQERSLDHNLAALAARATGHGDGPSGGAAAGPAGTSGLPGTLVRHDPDPAAALGTMTGTGTATGTGPAGMLSGARTVLLQLPRSLDALEQWAHLVAEHAAEDVVLLAGGRDKHMTPRQNGVLERHFTSVVPGRGRSKSRVLTARGPRRGQPAPFPRTQEQVLPGVGRVDLVAYGGTFGGARLDPGTALLLEHLGHPDHPGRRAEPADGHAPGRAVDVGCGNGTIAVYLARATGRSVVATDQSADACASTRETVRVNGLVDRVEVRRDDALASFPEASEDLLVLNPPFHAGNTVDPRVALRLIAESARVLRPGGQLWCVWNSHLRYRPELERLVGPTRQVARDRTFTVTVSTRR